MSSLNKRYLISSSITVCMVLLLFLASVFITAKKGKRLAEPIDQNAEISFVTIHKKIPAKKKTEKKPQTAKKIPSETIPTKNEEIPEKVEEEVTEQESEELSPEEADAVEKATATYKDYVLGRISAKKVYPIQARAKGQTGRVKLHIVISTDGALQNVEIVKPSAYEILNQASLNAVQKASPFRKMPSGMKPLDLTFLMDFALE